MPIRIVRLGSPRERGEGLRIGTVRRPPRGVPKSQYAARNFFDVWLPLLAPSADAVRAARLAVDERGWRTFARTYRTQMAKPESRAVLDLLAALSHRTALSVGCYCADESRCHRSLLRQLLCDRGADVN